MIVGLQKDYRIALFASPVPAEQYWNPVAMLFGVVEGGRIVKDFEGLYVGDCGWTSVVKVW